MIGIRVESDDFIDAISELVRISKALPSRHGQRFRALERRLEALIDNMPDPKVQPLETPDGATIIMVTSPGEEITAVIAEARRLGV